MVKRSADWPLQAAIKQLGILCTCGSLRKKESILVMGSVEHLRSRSKHCSVVAVCDLNEGLQVLDGEIVAHLDGQTSNQLLDVLEQWNVELEARPPMLEPNL